MYKELSKALQDSIEAYYRWWNDTYPNETVYAFCFFSEPLVRYAGVVVFTEEGLKKVAKEYKADEYYKNKDLVSLEKDLRWSPCDSPHHYEKEDDLNDIIFDGVNNSLNKIFHYTDSLALDDPKFEEHLSNLYSSFVKALNGFREKSLNGSQKIILSVWFGDQSEEEIKYFITNCNGPKLIDKFNNEWQ